MRRNPPHASIHPRAKKLILYGRRPVRLDHMNTPLLRSPVPAHLWATLETVFQEKVRLLAKDIAKQLGNKPVTPLLTALAEKKTSLYIFEECDTDRDTSMRCSYLCLRPSAPFFLQECGQPVVWSAHLQRCPEHCYKEDLIPPNVPILKQLEDDSELLYLAEDSCVFDAQNILVGRFETTTKILTRFVIDEKN